MTRQLVLAAFAVVLLGACDSTGDYVGSPVAAPAESPSVEADYGSAERLLDDLRKAGIHCIKWKPVEIPLAAEERGSCYIGEEEVVASIYASHREASTEPQRHADVMVALAGVMTSDVVMVVGGNWTFNCDSVRLCVQIQEKFGGELVAIPK